MYINGNQQENKNKIKQVFGSMATHEKKKSTNPIITIVVGDKNKEPRNFMRHFTAKIGKKMEIEKI